MERSPADPTTLLRDAAAGRPGAADALYGRLYNELKRLASARLHAHRPGATLDTTGLVHEAYLRLVDRASVEPVDRAHFLALAARAMRYVLLDRARARLRQKRGGGAPELSLDAVQVAADDRAVDVIALDGALESLRERSARLADVVEYRFFGGLTYAEIAEVTGRSVATVERDWVRARLWLYRALQDPESPADEGPGAGPAMEREPPPP
ncbi:ECF-type sigma factor [Rubrivirga sp.]|uniref:ECF-type sigma factor n=1 Tax=Rubrivirga sp. TaxID=1885344 RepID=UPI003B52D30D